MAGFDKYVKSLLHCNKDNLSKLINDEVSSNNWQIRGQPRISKENTKFNSSYHFDSNKINSFRLNRKISLGVDKDFTLDFWICNRDINSLGRLLEFYNNDLFSELSLFIENNRLKIEGIGEGYNQSEFFVDLELNELTHIGIFCYAEISRLYLYKNGYKQGTLIFKIPEGDYNIVFGDEVNLSNLDLSISEIRMSNFRRFKSDFYFRLSKEFECDDNDIFFLKFKDSVVDLKNSSQGFSVISGYHELTNLNSPFKSSLYLSGSNSRLESNEDIQLGGKDFCIDGWVYIENNSDISISSIFEFVGLKLVFNNLTSTLLIQVEDKTYILPSIWNKTLFHFALVFRLLDNNSINFYLNGQGLLKIENVNLFSNFQSGKFIYGSNLKCYFSELRISSGIARFIGDFKLPRVPYSIDTFNKSTKVLLHLNQTSLKDERGNDWKLVDESIHFSKDGARFSNAVEFYKDGQYLYLPELILGVSDFTIEFWTTSKFYDYNYKYLNYFKDSQGTLFCLINKFNTQVIQLSVIKDNFYRLIVLINSKKYIWNFEADFNKLYHIAVEYILNKLEINLYLNGQKIVYHNESYKLQLEKPINPDKFRIYLGNNSLGNDFYQGTFNDFRISKIARYLNRFIPEEKEFVLDLYTLSLLHLNSSAHQDLINNEWILIQGNSKTSLLVDNSVFFGKALKLNGFQYLIMEDKPLYLGGQDFTLDLFVKIDSSIKNNGNIFELFNSKNNFNLGLRRYKESQGVCLRIGCILNNYKEIIFDKENLLDKFCHIALIYIDELFELNLYINGIKREVINCFIERQAFDFVTLGKPYFNKEGYFKGVIDEFRIIDGIALWTKEQISVPSRESSCLTNIDIYTESLFHFDESATKDESGNLWLKEGLSTGVKLSSLVYKFPYQSAYFDGKSSLRFLNKLELGNSDFLIDFYIYLEKLSQGSITKLIQIYNNQFTVENAIHCYINNESRKLQFSVNYSDRLESKSQINYNQFYRISILFKKDLNTFVLYINNLEENFIFYSIKPTVYSNLVIGHSGSDTSYFHWFNSFFTGYIDKFRITTDADNFLTEDNSSFYLDSSKLFIVDNRTKSLLQFIDYRLRDSYKEGNWSDIWNLKGESILLHLDESFLDSFVNNNWELIGTPVIKACPESLFLDESVSYAFYNNGKDFNYLCNNNVNLNEIFNNDFNLDFWVYLETTEHNQGFISSNMSEFYWEGFAIFCANKNLRFAAKFNDSWKDLDFFKLEENVWIHIALVRKGNVLSGYKNGILKNSFEIGDFQGIDSQLNIGYWYRTGTGYGGLLEGYLREIRIEKTAIWTDNNFILPSSKNDNFYLLKDNFIKNSLTLMKEQYLEKDISVELSNDFSIEAYVSLEENQTCFLLEGLVNKLAVSLLNSKLLFLIINNKPYEVFVESNIKDSVHQIAVEYILDKLEIRVYIDSNLVRIIDQVKFTDSSFKVFIGRGVNGELNGIKLINEFRISDIARTKYLLKEDIISKSDKDLILLQFKEDVLKDEVIDNQWKIEGEKNLLPVLVSEEDYSFFSRFGSSLYLPRNTYLRLVNSKGLNLGGRDFSIESWVYLLGSSILVSARNTISKDKLVIKLTKSSIVVQFNNRGLEVEYNLTNLFHMAIEYRNQYELISIYINGKEIFTARDIEIPEIYFDRVNIGFDEDLGNSSMYLDEFRISNGIARWKGNFLLEIQPYRLLSYPKKLAVRNKESGLIEYISLYYDIPNKGYSIFDKESGTEVYAELSELEDVYLNSNLITRIDNQEYILPRESIRVLKGLEYIYRFNKIKHILEYTPNGIQSYKPVKSLLGNSINSINSLEFNPILVLREELLEEELLNYINIYKNVITDSDEYTYYKLSFVQSNLNKGVPYLSYKINKNNIELVLSKEGLSYRILGEDEIEFIDNIFIKIIGSTEVENRELSYRIIDSSNYGRVSKIIEFSVIGNKLCYRILDSNGNFIFVTDKNKLGYRINRDEVEFIIDGEQIDYKVIGTNDIEFSIVDEKLNYQVLNRVPSEVINFDFDEQIIQLYLLLSDYWRD